MDTVKVELTTDDICEELCKIIYDDIDDDWKRATIHAVINDEDDVTFQGVYSDSSSTTEHYFHTRGDVYELVLEMRQLFQQSDGRLFKNVDFSLENGGDYELSYQF